MILFSLGKNDDYKKLDTHDDFSNAFIISVQIWCHSWLNYHPKTLIFKHLICTDTVNIYVVFNDVYCCISMLQHMSRHWNT